MKDKNKKLIVISVVILLLALLMFLIGYAILKNKIDQGYDELKRVKSGYNKELAKKEDQLIKEDLKSPNYIGIDGFFLGAIENYTNFYSANEPYESAYTIDANNKVVYKKYTADDLLNKDNYIYENNVIIRKSNKIFYDKDLNPEYYYQGDINLFRYNYVNEFDVEEVKDAFYINTTKPIDLSKAKRIEKIKEENFKDYQKYVDKYFKDSEVSKTELMKDIFISNVLVTDLNEDGTFETYIVLNTKADSNNEMSNGNYSALLAVDGNENVKRVMELIVDKDAEIFNLTAEITNIEVIDLNNDGLKEMIIKTMSWDVPEVYVFNTDRQGSISLVMQGNFAW